MAVLGHEQEQAAMEGCIFMNHTKYQNSFQMVDVCYRKFSFTFSWYFQKNLMLHCNLYYEVKIILKVMLFLLATQKIYIQWAITCILTEVIFNTQFIHFYKFLHCILNPFCKPNAKELLIGHLKVLIKNKTKMQRIS